MATTTTTTTPKPPPPPPQPPTKPHLNNRHPYRPNPNLYRRSRNRNYFCLCCFWSILIIILLLLIASIAGCILYLLYRPHRPSFTITSLKISNFNLTTNSDDVTHLTSNLNLTLSTKNPNKKVSFYYDPITITLLTIDDTQIGNGSFRDSFVSEPNNITVIKSVLVGTNVLMESSTVNRIRSDLKKVNGMKLKIFLDTKTQVKIESVKSKKVGIRIVCDGIHSLVPKKNGGGGRNKTAAEVVTATVTEAKCDVDLRIKIWKWTFSS